MEKEAPLEVAQGHFSAEDILAPEPAHRYTNSAMDGFSLRYADCSAASEEQPARLRLIVKSQAGIFFTGVVGSGWPTQSDGYLATPGIPAGDLD